jgi:hypothetical protein
LGTPAHKPPSGDQTAAVQHLPVAPHANFASLLSSTHLFEKRCRPRHRRVLIFASRRVEHITRTFAEIAPDEYDAARIADVAASLPH